MLFFCRKSRMLAPFVLKSKMRHLLMQTFWLGSSSGFMLRSNEMLFNWDCAVPWRLASVYFASSSSLCFFLFKAQLCLFRFIHILR